MGARDLIQILFFILLVKPLMKLLVGIRVHGKENLPTGQFILVANHASHLDTLALLSLFPPSDLIRIRPVAAADYWKRNALIYGVSRLLFNILPIPRSGITRTNNPLHLMTQALEEGYSLLIFPEGTRDYGENLGPFRPGVAHLVKRFPHIPCIPVFLKNTGRILPKGQFLPVPLFVDVVVGKPIIFRRDAKLEEILELLQKKVTELSHHAD